MPTNEPKNRRNKTDYGMKYPYNKVTVTESGHEIHIDDTPGKERIRISHKDGTFVEVSAGGKMISHVVGNEQKYNKSGVTETVDHNKDSKVEGHSRNLTGGGSHGENTGDGGAVYGGHFTIVVGGSAKIAIAGDAYMGVAGDMNINAGGNMNMKVAGTTTMESGGDTVIKGANVRIN